MAEARNFRIVCANGDVLELDERSIPNQLKTGQRIPNDESQIWFWDGQGKDVLRNQKSGGFLSGGQAAPILVDSRIVPKDEDRWQFQGGELKRKDRRYLALDATTCALKPRNGTRSQRWVLESVAPIATINVRGNDNRLQVWPLM